MGNEQRETAITQRQLWTAIPIIIGLLVFFAGIMAAYWSLKLDINTIQQKQSAFEENIKNINDNTKKIDTRTQGISDELIRVVALLGLPPSSRPVTQNPTIPSQASKIDLPNPAPNYQQSQTVIAQAPSPTPTPDAQPTPQPTPTLTPVPPRTIPIIPNHILPTITIPILGVTIGGR